VLTVKNVLWICNHSTLLQCECPLLRSFGWGVFIPKVNTSTQRSSATEYSYDKSLQILQEDLLLLNRFDFYHGQYTPEIQQVINKYFQVIFCINHPPLIAKLLEFFTGKVIIRAFGYEGDMNYEKSTVSFAKRKIPWRINRNLKYNNAITRTYYKYRKKLILGVAYKEIIDNETPFFHSRSIYLPLGIPSSIWKNSNTWNGNTPKIMFVCPSIDTPYYGNIFMEFMRNFGDLPHKIFGFQKTDCFNRNIIGFLERKPFDQYMRDFAVMFYHSQEKRHLHYHPLEAIVMGMPIVFMSGGILETVSGANKPGMATSIYMAREMLIKALNKDSDLVSEIKREQCHILESFTDSYVERHWQNALDSITK